MSPTTDMSYEGYREWYRAANSSDHAMVACDNAVCTRGTTVAQRRAAYEHALATAAALADASRSWPRDALTPEIDYVAVMKHRYQGCFCRAHIANTRKLMCAT